MVTEEQRQSIVTNTTIAVRPGPGCAVVGAFLHADAASEQQLRDMFTRVYRCRRLESNA